MPDGAWREQEPATPQLRVSGPRWGRGTPGRDRSQLPLLSLLGCSQTCTFWNERPFRTLSESSDISDVRVLLALLHSLSPLFDSALLNSLSQNMQESPIFPAKQEENRGGGKNVMTPY